MFAHRWPDRMVLQHMVSRHGRQPSRLGPVRYMRSHRSSVVTKSAAVPEAEHCPSTMMADCSSQHLHRLPLPLQEHTTPLSRHKDGGMCNRCSDPV